MTALRFRPLRTLLATGALALLTLAPPPLPALGATTDAPAYVIGNDQLPALGTPGAIAPALTRAPDGTVHALWIDQAGGRENAVRLARFDPTTFAWGPALTIAHAATIAGDALEPPSLSIGADGQLAATWPVRETDTGSRPWWSVSNDHGQTWSDPAPVSPESLRGGHARLIHLDALRVLAVWVDQRAGTGPRAAPGLYSRVLGESGPDQRLDDAVTPNDAPALVAFPDGDILAVYRTYRDGVLELAATRWRDGAWSAPQAVSRDQWTAAPDRPLAPALAQSGPFTAAAWFTVNEGHPTLQVSSSTLAGERFPLAQPIDDGHPLGRPSVVVLADQSILTVWFESREATGAELWLRRISPRGTLNVPVRLARLANVNALGLPQLTLLKDYDDTPGQLLLVHPTGTHASGLQSRLITLPDPKQLIEDENCGCDPTTGPTAGYAIRGEILAVDPAAGTVTLRHEPVPGLLRAGTTTFSVAPPLPASLTPGRQILAKTFPRTPTWLLSDLRLLARRPPPTTAH